MKSIIQTAFKRNAKKLTIVYALLVAAAFSVTTLTAHAQTVQPPPTPTINPAVIKSITNDVARVTTGSIADKINSVVSANAASKKTQVGEHTQRRK